MIIDLILDRKDGKEYNAKQFYNRVMEYENDMNSFAISTALDSGNEKDIRKMLCIYITRNGYNPEICNFINELNWIQ